MESQYIEDLTKVFETLNILEEKVNKNVNTEQEEIMFGYSSDSTDSDGSIKMNTGEETSTYRNPDRPETSTAGTRNSVDTRHSERPFERKRKERGYFDLDSDYESGYKHGYMKSQGKWKSIPSSFIPVKKDLSIKYRLLDLDCKYNPLKHFEEWVSIMQLEISTNSTIQKMSHLEFLKYSEYRCTGIVRSYFGDNTDEMTAAIIQKMHNEGDNPTQWFTIIAQRIYLEFFGKNMLESNASVRKEENNKAVWFLTNVQICNMCYLEEFICSYRKYFYELKREQRETFNSFLSKNFLIL